MRDAGIWYVLHARDLSDRELDSFSPRERQVIQCMSQFSMNTWEGNQRHVVEMTNPFRMYIRAMWLLGKGGRLAVYGCRRTVTHAGSPAGFWYAHLPVTCIGKLKVVRDQPELPPMHIGGNPIQEMVHARSNCRDAAATG